MIRSIFWKEFREQRLIAAFLPISAALIVWVAPLFAQSLQMQSSDLTAFNQTVLIIFALGCGLVTGAQHWAAEKEAGTLTLLDLQPRFRSSLWCAKTAYCIVQWLLQILVITLVGVLVSAIPQIRQFETWQPLVTIYGMSFLALCWSLMASARTRTPLAAIGWGLLAVILAPLGIATLMSLDNVIFRWTLASYFYFSKWQLVVDQIRFIIEAILSSILFAIVPLAISYRWVTKLDRTRSGAVETDQTFKRFQSFRTGLQLAWRDSQNLLIPFGICMILNTALIHVEPNLLWLFTGLLMGVFAGTSATDQEQNQGVFKLWADQRLPIGVLWSAKVFSRLALLVAGCLITLVLKAMAIYLYGPMTTSRVLPIELQMAGFIAMVTPLLTLLAIGPITGFGVGLVFGLVTRKKIIAWSGAVLTSLIILVCWLPIIGSGGLRVWQWAAIPLAFGLAARLLVWPWVTAQLKSKLVVAGLCLPLVFTACDWGFVERYRVSSVPAVPPLFDTQAFLNETNTTKASQAADRLTEIAREVDNLGELTNYRSLNHDEAIDLNLRSPRFNERMVVMGNLKSPQFNERMEKVVTEKWLTKLDSIADTEVVAFEDLTQISYEPSMKRQSLSYAGDMLIYDALRLEVKGDLEKSVDRFRQALQLSRQMNHRATSRNLSWGNNLETNILFGFNYWLSGQTSKSDIPALKKLLTLLDEHMKKRATSEEHFKCNYLDNLNFVQNPKAFWEGYMLQGTKDNPLDSDSGRLSIEIWTSANGTKAERKRRKAIYDLYAAGLLKTAQADYPTLFEMEWSKLVRENPQKYSGADRYRRFYVSDWITPLQNSPTPESNTHDYLITSRFMDEDIQLQYGSLFRQYRRIEIQQVAVLEMVKLAIALRGHRLEHGEYPKTLKELSPSWFAEVPKNPFTLKSFGYELKEGKAILKADDPFQPMSDSLPEGFDFPKPNHQQKPFILVLPAFVVK